MIFPKVKEVYIYKGKKYIVLVHSLFRNVLIQDYVENDSADSKFHYINWLSFVLNAKHIGTVKNSNAY